MAEPGTRYSHSGTPICLHRNLGPPKRSPRVCREPEVKTHNRGRRHPVSRKSCDLAARLGSCVMAELYTWPSILTTLLDRRDLSVSESTWAMRRIMSGEATPSQLGAFLVALRAKGETVDEIVGFRDAILEAAVPLRVDPAVLDIVGTGGDRFGTVNISTMSALVAAASGIPVVKHGNRAASSSSGSSDVLGALGVDLSLPPEAVAEALPLAGITFAF